MAEQGPQVLTLPVEKLMNSPGVTCGAGYRMENAMVVMTNVKIRHLSVVEAGEPIGIVRIEDLVKYRLDEKALEASVFLDVARLHA